MKFRKTLLAVMIAASLGGITQAPQALADVEIFFGTAPPALRYEAVPAPRRGYVWAPGYWDGNRGKHVWKRGQWQRSPAQAVASTCSHCGARPCTPIPT